jgi:UDP-N-acetylglucosamine/UDP-N-acetylgalactosamine 4-epimerase
MTDSYRGAFESQVVAVTGGAGFIGSHLVDALVAAGARVRVIDNLSTGRASNLAHQRERIEIVEGDIRDLEVCKRVARGARYVFHQAALGSVPRSLLHPAQTMDNNVQGTVNVLTAARDERVERVVYASSSSVYGDSEILPKAEGNEGSPLSPYALSKKMNEELAATYARCFGLATVGLRYFNVYGPRQSPDGPYAAVIPRFIAAAAQNEPPAICGDGDQSRDFTYVADAVQANLKAALAPREACGRAYNVGAGNRTTVLGLARAILSAVGASVEPRHVEAREGDVRHSLANIDRARGALGYDPAFPLELGLRETVAAIASR